MRDLHQSPMYAHFMKQIGWSVEGKSGSQIFYRTFGPFSIAKVQRPSSLDPLKLKQFRRSHHTLLTYVEPGQNLHSFPGITVEPYSHSCTSLVDLTPSEKSILNSFSQKTRYNIVHTLKQNKLKIVTTPLSAMSHRQLTDFFTLHQNWSKQKDVIGYPKSLLLSILKSFAKSGDLHLAYSGDDLVGSLLILYHDLVATYYAAFASDAGYHLYAPTLLTWAAMQAAKARGCDIFDFGGIYDPRYPKMYKKWQGFTKFKEGFRPTVVSYPPTTLQLFW